MRLERTIGMIAGMAALAALSGCGASDGGNLSTPPRMKPATLPVQLDGPTEDTAILGSVSTRDGELRILENDGSVTRTKVDSTQGRMTLRQSDADMLALSDVLVSDDLIPLEDLPKPPKAQDIALEEFAARRGSALPARIVPAEADKFLLVSVRPYATREEGKPSDLVAVLVNVAQGVDESAAFAYATCTLAAWSKTTNTPYARHIRTLTREDNGVLAVESTYIMSKSIPMGLQVMERDKTLSECRANGIPARVMVGPAEGMEKNG
ncbi:MAG: hypothetical protein ACK5LJ_05385 [Paracoccus sp. (in: a-proteobacteria)]